MEELLKDMPKVDPSHTGFMPLEKKLEGTVVFLSAYRITSHEITDDDSPNTELTPREANIIFAILHS